MHNAKSATDRRVDTFLDFATSLDGLDPVAPERGDSNPCWAWERRCDSARRRVVEVQLAGRVSARELVAVVRAIGFHLLDGQSIPVTAAQLGVEATFLPPESLLASLKGTSLEALARRIESTTTTASRVAACWSELHAHTIPERKPVPVERLMVAAAPLFTTAKLDDRWLALLPALRIRFDDAAVREASPQFDEERFQALLDYAKTIDPIPFNPTDPAGSVGLKSLADLVAVAKAKAARLDAPDQQAAVATLDAMFFASVVRAANVALGVQVDGGRDGFMSPLQGAASDLRVPPRR